MFETDTKMDAFAIVILWIAEGNENRRKCHQALLDLFCSNHLLDNSDMTMIKTRVMSVVEALPDYSIKKFICQLDRAVDSKKKLTFAQKIVLKSRMRYIIYNDDWTYQIIPLVELFPQLAQEFPFIQYL